MTRKVRIIGGGLTGMLAGLEAHRLGFQDIELHDPADRLGGTALPRMDHGRELRDRCQHFGPSGDPVRSLMASHGIVIEDFENRIGSVSPAPAGDLTYSRGFAGPALYTRELDLAPVRGDSLADRLRAYPADIQGHLTRYCRWYLGTWLDEVHASSAQAMGIGRVFPTSADPADLAAMRRSLPLFNELYDLPAALTGRLDGLTASLPEGGMTHAVLKLQQALIRSGATIRVQSLVSPDNALADMGPDDILVWAANPMPLFKAFDLVTPRASSKTLTTYVFRLDHAGAVPLQVHNFTATGAVTQISVYETRGQVLLSAECVGEVGDVELRREIHRLMAGFGGAGMTIQEQLAVTMEPRWGCPSVEAVRGIAQLRAVISRRYGSSLVTSGWEAGDLTSRFKAIGTELARARDGAVAVAA